MEFDADGNPIVVAPTEDATVVEPAGDGSGNENAGEAVITPDPLADLQKRFEEANLQRDTLQGQVATLMALLQPQAQQAPAPPPPADPFADLLNPTLDPAIAEEIKRMSGEWGEEFAGVATKAHTTNAAMAKLVEYLRPIHDYIAVQKQQQSQGEAGQIDEAIAANPYVAGLRGDKASWDNLNELHENLSKVPAYAAGTWHEKIARLERVHKELYGTSSAPPPPKRPTSMSQIGGGTTTAPKPTTPAEMLQGAIRAAQAGKIDEYMKGLTG